jgi:hypothetical protein
MSKGLLKAWIRWFWIFGASAPVFSVTQAIAEEEACAGRIVDGRLVTLILALRLRKPELFRR